MPSTPPPPTAASPQRAVVSPPADGRSRNIAVVANYLNEGLERGLSEVEIQGCISLLQGSQGMFGFAVVSGRRVDFNGLDEEVEKPAPFRFTTTVRGTTAAPEPTASTANGPPAPRRMLSKNPNGTYVWRGGGSAKPRNRYTSPGFGSSRSAPTLKLSPEKLKQNQDGKRRKIDNSVELSMSANPSTASRSSGPTAQLNSSASAPNVNNAAGSSSSMPFPNSARSPSPASQQTAVAPKLNGAATAPPSTPRLRTAGMKPTAPAIPSPLRQAWGQNDPPSPPPPQPKPKPTRAANIMTELIKETAPPPKPVFSNPYQEACPVPLRPTKKPPLPRRRAPAVAQADKAKAPVTPAGTKTEKTQERKVDTALSPQKIIEATLPKVLRLVIISDSDLADHDYRVPSVPDLLQIWANSRSSFPQTLCEEAQG